MSEYLPQYDMWVTQLKMPIRIKGFCKRRGADNCAVINEDLSDDEKRKAVEHEAEHFKRNDLQSSILVSEIEKAIE